ncbi:MAG: TRAP transporter TatT component family protein [Pyrinomonadaceae bacterium]
MLIKKSIIFAALALSSAAFLSGCGAAPAADQSAPSAAIFPLKDYMAKASESYKARTDLAKAKEAYNLMVAAHKSNPKDYEGAWLLAKYAYYLGSHSPEKSDGKEVFNAGIKAGEDAVTIDANKPEGHFWLAANLGGRAQISMMDGAADTEDIRKHMQEVIKLDPGFQSGSAYMAIGQIDLELPRLMGGDPQAAVKQLEGGLKYGADNSLYHLRLAEAYYAVGRTDDAKKQLEVLAQLKPNPDFLPEHADALKGANDLAAKF